MNKYRAYIHSLNNFPIADWAVSAYQGFRESQMDCIFFEDIEEVPSSKYNIVVSNIEDTNKYFERLGIGPKLGLNIPHELMSYTKRWIVPTKMERVRNGGYVFPLFIKPNRRAKEFYAGVVKTRELLDFHFRNIEDDTPVLLSEPIELITEYRGYVCDGALMGIYWYSGDFRKFVDCRIVDQAIEDYKSQPAGYTIDFGLTDKGETVLIECNDGWSIGNYGLDHTKYAKLLFKRWRQLMNHG